MLGAVIVKIHFPRPTHTTDLAFAPSVVRGLFSCLSKGWRLSFPAMASIAKVVVEISLDREFDYRIPAHLQDSIRVGSQVEVPFKSRELRGFVVGLANHSAFGDKLKEIAGVVGDKPLIPDEIMKLAYWIADYYCAPIEAAVRTVLPSAVRKRGARHKKQLFVSLNVDGASSSVREERKTVIDPLLAQAESTRSAQPNGAGCSVYEEERINYFDIHEPIGNEQGNLPHWRQEGATYFITFRLGDSLPQSKLNQWKAELATWQRAHPEPHDEETRREYCELFPARFQNWLDQGMGSCVLAKSEIKQVVENALICMERAYFRKASGIGKFKKGMVAIIYVSASGGGGKELLGWARITSSQLMHIDDVKIRLSRQGVLSDDELSECANKDRLLHAFTFDNFSRFPKQVQYDELKARGFIDGANLVTAQLLPGKKLEALCDLIY